MAAGAPGAGSEYTQRLHASFKEVHECARDFKLFVNESEAVLARFHRALLQFKRQGFSDEVGILRGVAEKEQVVHFLLDCVRNRHPLWVKVSEVRKNLTETDASWAQAWKSHLSRCATCRTVDLERARPPPPPGTKWPIPFAAELLALLGLLLPIFAIGQGCDCSRRLALLILGLMLMLPWLVFEGLWRWRRPALLAFMASGAYAVGGRRLEPPGACRCRFWSFLWRPSRWLYLDPPQVCEIGVPRARRIETDEGYRERGWTSFGEWCLSSPRPSASIGGPPRRTADTPGRLIQVSCASKRWEERAAELGDDGSISGLNSNAYFDGNAILIDGAGSQEHWAKLGWRRLDWMRKALGFLAAAGLLMAFVAAAFYPGITFDCFPETVRFADQPLVVFFNLDASSSMSQASWNRQKDATNIMLDAFDTASDFYAGVAQFSTSAALEQSITNDMALVKQTVSGMAQSGGTTNAADAFKLCASQLRQHIDTLSGELAPLGVCVVMSDGTANDDALARQASQQLKDQGFKVMGIFVGNSQTGADALKAYTSCDGGSDPNCIWFAEATDFNQLIQRAKDIAENIVGEKEQKEIREVNYDCDLPTWTVAGILLMAPFIAWWVYLHFSDKCAPRGHIHKDPQRLLVAGGGERRTDATGVEIGKPSRM